MSRADLMLGGQSVGVAGVPILNPLLTLSAFNFDVFKVRPAHPTQCRVFIIRQTPHASIIASAARHFYGPLLKSEPLIKPLAYMAIITQTLITQISTNSACSTHERVL